VRFQRRQVPLGLFAAAALLLADVACEKEDLGKACGTPPDAVVNPVGGETPTIEVVRVERDSTCDSFQCLTQLGVPPYCTRICKLEAAPNATSCKADTDCAGAPFSGTTHPGVCVDGTCLCREDSQCKDPTHCADGACVDDDCPNGFWCERVQDVGPLAKSRYCVYKTGCQTNIQCEDLSNIACNKLGCFDACQRDFYTCDKPAKTQCDDLECYNNCIHTGGTQYLCLTLTDSCKTAGCFDNCTPPPGAACDFHRLVCDPLSDLGCGPAPGAPSDCQVDIHVCADNQMVCRPDAAQNTWVAGAVRKLDVCMPK
jgi:hypothetical protein